VQYNRQQMSHHILKIVRNDIIGLVLQIIVLLDLKHHYLKLKILNTLANFQDHNQV